MIQAQEFVEAAREQGFKRYTGVPCSFLTPFINYVISDENLNYVSSANEGDALATAAGAAIGGERSIAMMQNSGLGNAVSPITSLSHVFRIPMLIITTHRGAAGLKDEPQHELMGKITGEMLDTMQVPWETFPSETQQIAPALHRAHNYMQYEQRPYAFIMQKGAVAPHPLVNVATDSINSGSPVQKEFITSQDKRPARYNVLQRIIDLTPETGTILIATTGYTGRELFSIADRPSHIYMVGSMGCASSLGLGLALARPDLHVIIIDGDGAALMRMGNFATIGSYAGANLTHILLDNEVHDSTGAQATVSANVAFTAIAAACGYAVAFAGNDIDLIDELLAVKNLEGPRFGHLKIRAGTIENLPRPDIAPADVLRRTMRHIGSQF
ncbi:MAG: phosphonopyruvate decarboxylase [Gammaproteobacteria bacterium]